MRILTVAPGPKFSTFDTFKYYTKAFAELGHQVSAFNYHDHYAYHATALTYIEDGDAEDFDLQRRAMMLAAEDLIARIARKQPEMVFVVSGLALPSGVWDWFDTFNDGLKKQFATTVLFTESPYIDETQHPIISRTDVAITMDKSSLEEFKTLNENSMYIRHAYEPTVHSPQPMSVEHGADVFMVGTGFPERIKMLAGIDWAGIDFRLFGGNWDDLGEEYLGDYYTPEFLDNEEEVPLYYTNSKISLNIYRTAKWPGENVLHIDPGVAYSVSPRCYEIMGCGGFLLTDSRPELLELFEDGKDMVIFDGAEDLGDKIRYYMNRPRQRAKIAASGLRAVAEHTYVNRAAEILENIDDNWRVL